jgi:hypothetical protein
VQDRRGEGRGGGITTCAPVEERKEIDGRIDGWEDRQTDRDKAPRQIHPAQRSARILRCVHAPASLAHDVSRRAFINSFVF